MFIIVFIVEDVVSAKTSISDHNIITVTSTIPMSDFVQSLIHNKVSTVLDGLDFNKTDCDLISMHLMQVNWAVILNPLNLMDCTNKLFSSLCYWYYQ